MATKTTFHYFISYTYNTSVGQSFSNFDIQLPKPIEAIEEIRGLEQVLRDRHHTSDVVVLGYTLLQR